MDGQVAYTGFVISASPIGEYDKRLVVLTRQKGKITVFAHGARKQHSQFGAGTRPFSYGKFSVYQGRNAYNLSSISIDDYFEKLVNDFESAYYAMYFLELADYYTKEGLEANDTVELIYNAFNSLMDERIPNRLVRRVYELKLMTINGEALQSYECLACKEKYSFENPKQYVYSQLMGGIICKKCASEKTTGITVALSSSTIYALQYVISYPINKVFKFNLKDEIFKEFDEVIAKHIMEYIDKKFNSLEILESATDCK